MPRRSCCRAAEGAARRALLPLALLGLVTAAAPLRAATVLARTVEVEIRGDGAVAEQTHLEVRLETATDLDAWATHPILLNENRELTRLSAWVRRPDGRTVNARRAGEDTADVHGAGELHSSYKARLVTFPAATIGDVAGLEYETVEHPYFPAGRVPLGGGDPVARLSVRVRGGGAGWRWRIAGRTPGLTVTEAAGGVLVTAADLPRPPHLEDSPDEVREGPELLFAWGNDTSWAAVGRWYEALTRDVRRDREAMRQAAGRILGAQPAGGAAGTASAGAATSDAGGAGGMGDERSRLEAILAFLRQDVRYVAVEMGIGGYRPAPAQETLARRWGDCKAKVMLFLGLLEEAGITAFPALVDAAPDGRIDPELPTPTVFNHMIAALPAAGLAVGPDDPVAGGYLFVDPTQEQGGAGWLHPMDQDQLALVLRGDRTELVRTPLLPRLETVRLDFDLAVRPDGGAAGRLRFALRGAGAAAMAERIAEESPETVETEGRRLIAGWLPGAAIATLQWKLDAKAAVPEATLSAEVRIASFVAVSTPATEPPQARGAGEPAAVARWLSLGGPQITPAPGTLRERVVPLVLRPHEMQIAWHLALPPGWCPDQADQSGLENALGTFHQSLACAGDRLTVERRTELRRRWIDPPQLPSLAELALAEHRAAARRLRLDHLH
jgi:hypothetical protein